MSSPVRLKQGVLFVSPIYDQSFMLMVMVIYVIFIISDHGSPLYYQTFTIIIMPCYA